MAIQPDQGPRGAGAAAQLHSRVPWPAAKSDAIADAQAQVANDPLAKSGPDGWTPEHIVAVHSQNPDGFIGTAVDFVTFGGATEQPGQRLTQGQVDALAPFYATQFGLDEGRVREELAKVYFYVGGPAAGGNMAMTFGTHIFMPTEDDLDRILSKDRGERWLSHELSHTMQSLAYEGGDRTHREVAHYATSQLIAHNPEKPGSGGGPLVWGTLFSAMRMAGRPESDLGKPATGVRDRLASSLLPAAVLSVPISVVAGGALTAGRATTGHQLLGVGNGMRTSFQGIFAPAMAGAAIGAFGTTLGSNWSGALGAVAGGAITGLSLWRNQAFAVGGSHATTELTHSLGRGAAIALAAGATLAGAAIGYTAARTSANTIQGWSNTAPLLAAINQRDDSSPEEKLTFQEAMHDSDWLEIDAEANARAFVRDTWDKPEPGSGPVAGRIPKEPRSLKGRVAANVSDRVDWGFKMPFMVGVPAALGVGGAVLATRGASTVLRTTIKDGHGLGTAIQNAMLMLGEQKRGLVNSLGIGGAVTVMPLMAGGLVAPFAYDITGSKTVANITGGASGALVGGALLTLLLKGKGSGLIATSSRVAAGMAVAGAMGVLAGGVATDAMRARPHEYDISKGTHAGE